MVGTRSLSTELQQRLRIYQLEPLGSIFIDKLGWTLSFIVSLLGFLFFGVLLILHRMIGNNAPPQFADLFTYPSTGSFYYPNLIAIGFDLIFHPLLFAFLFWFRNYVPQQFMKLEEDGQITLRLQTTVGSRMLHLLSTNYHLQRLSIIALPLLLGFFLTINSISFYRPVDLAGWYSVLLTYIANYGRIAILVYVVYVFLILGTYSITVQLKVRHPDRCSGLAPFGNLAVALYALIFVGAVFQAVASSVQVGALERVLASILGSGVLYLWFLFPLMLVIVFEALISRPHVLARQWQHNLLEMSSNKWNEQRERILQAITADLISSANKTNREQIDIEENVKLLEAWSTLDSYIADANTWPVSSITFRIVVLLFNPLLPILIPVAVNLISANFT